MNLFDKFVSYLTPGHLEGIMLFIASTLIMTFVHIHFKKEWTQGLKGINGLWEGPEILLYISCWIIPPMMFAELFLQLHAPEIVWYTAWVMLLIGAFGRWGLEWLLAFKSGASQVTSTTIEKEKEKTKETTTVQ